MGLFSRRQKSEPVPASGVEPGEQPIEDGDAAEPSASRGVESGEQPVSIGDAAGTGASDSFDDGASGAAGDGVAAASVNISVSAFRGNGAPSTPAAPPKAPANAVPRRAAPAEAPPPSETVPGLRDNVLLRQALAALPATPGAPELMNVARQLLQGHVFVRVLGDARSLLAEGKTLPLAIATHGDKRYMLAYSGGAALQDAVRADGDVSTSATGQPVLTVLRHAVADTFDGLVLDNSSGTARAVLPRPVLERLIDGVDDALRIKTLLAGERTVATAAEVVAALADASLWVAVRRAEEGGALGVAESRTPDGQRFLEVFSHPMEVLALGRGDNPAPLTTTQLASAIAADAALTGVVVDPGGPWIRLTRDDLASLLDAA